MTARFLGSHLVPSGSSTSEPLPLPGSPSLGPLRGQGGGTKGEARRGLAEPNPSREPPHCLAERWRPIAGLPGYEISDRGRVRTWHGRRGGQRETPRLRKLDRDRRGCLWLHVGGAEGRRRLLVANLLWGAFPELGLERADDVLDAIDRARRELKSAALASFRRGDLRTSDAVSVARDHLARVAGDLARNNPEAAP